MNKNAIVFCINDAYTGQLGTTLLSLKDNSPLLYEQCDKIVYNDGIAENNVNILKKICPELKFLDLDKDNSVPKIIIDKHREWNCLYVIDKLCMLDLLDDYEHVIHIDTDTVIVKELAALLEADYDVAAAINDPEKATLRITGAIPDGAPDYPIVFGAIMAFSASIRNYGIKSESLLEYYTSFKTVPVGIEESLISYMCYNNKMNLLILDRDLWIAPTWAYNEEKTKIIHFKSFRNAKPWKDPLVYAAYPEWRHYYRKWLMAGGSPFLQFKDTDFIHPNTIYCILSEYAKSRVLAE